ncbi:MAG: sigma-54-dependent Fis family transcriptional regulator [Acidobacteria bacterium]|nr:sigma-54-dependent Fis family transcriptional regulator [Acidobacteriota bacterium]
MRLAMARVLERAGFEVTRCQDGLEALRALESRPWDALVTDVRMPRLDGRELLSRALALRPVLRVVVVTGFGTVEDAVQAIHKGASDYLLKPFAAEALEGAVRRALAPPTSASGPDGAGEPAGEDPGFLELLERARRAAGTDATVLLTGESGTGKEVLARYVHARSARGGGPFVAVNCAALPADLLEAELFGVCRGAYTGADRDRPGRFEQAHGGTLLLDEIGDFPLGLQAKLLRVLEERHVAPLGATRPRSVDVRLIAATNHDLVRNVAGGGFRQDLFFRLNVIPLRVPPLRERRGDIAVLATRLAGEVAGRLGRPAPEISPRALERLAAHHWPGNVRELRNVLERAVILDRRGRIGPGDLFLDEFPSSEADDRLEPGLTLADVERRLIERTLDAVGGNRTRASAMLGISVRTLRNKLREYRTADRPALASTP